MFEPEPIGAGRVGDGAVEPMAENLRTILDAFDAAGTGGGDILTGGCKISIFEGKTTIIGFYRNCTISVFLETTTVIQTSIGVGRVACPVCSCMGCFVTGLP